MPLEVRLLIGLAVALAVVTLTTPVAIRLANRLHFFDAPTGYKAHGAPTPYLGGSAVVAGFVVAVLLLGGSWDRTLPLLGGVVALWALGTADDRRTVAPAARVAVEFGLGLGLWGLGLGWDLGAGPALDAVASALWIVAVVNAFNLFDNMDGAAASMTAVVAGGLALLGVVEGGTWLAVTAAALCGAAVGFLPHNLFASPARIFLGDGGSMPLGFAVATVAMIGVSEAAPAWQSLAMGLLFVGIPALDTTLVMVSRRRRGLSILTGGRDHLTHRTRNRVRTARAVAVTLGGAQAVISALAVIAVTGGSSAVLIAVVSYLVGLGVAVSLLDARYEPLPAVGAPTGEQTGPRPLRRLPAAVLLLPLAAGIAASPFFAGYYDSTIWVPAALGLLGVATAGLIADPPRWGAAAGMLLTALVGLGLWALASAAWGDSIEQAVAHGDRWLGFAALAVVVLVLVRSDGAALLLLGAVAAGCVAVGIVVLVRLLGSDPGDLFLAGRLDSPLGYINGLASFFLLGAWLCLAAGERREPWLAGLGAAGATLLGGLALLSQSRGVALAAGISVLVVLAVAPGRVRRAWALAVVGGALAVAAPALVDVYEAARGGRLPADTGHRAAWHLLAVAAGAGIVWAHASWVAANAPGRERLRRAAAGALVALALAGVIAGIASAGRIADTLDRQYTAFVHLGVEPQGTGTRLVSGAGNRYDYWRIAVDAWKSAPLQGVGAGNYDRPYFAHRATAEDVRQPHSLELQVLAELGLVGAALLLLALAGVALGVAQTTRAARGSASARTVLVGGLGVMVAWLVHTSVDWIHLLPGVTAIALVAAVCLARARRAPQVGAAARSPAGAGAWLPRLGVALVVTLAAVSLSRQGLSERFLAQARTSLASDPAQALREADRALRIDPESIGAYYAKAAALARFNQPGAARGALTEAARREPGNFVTWALLGDLSVRAGRFGEAKRDYTRALRLNPRDPSLIALARDPRTALPER